MMRLSADAEGLGHEPMVVRQRWLRGPETTESFQSVLRSKSKAHDGLIWFELVDSNL